MLHGVEGGGWTSGLGHDEQVLNSDEQTTVCPGARLEVDKVIEGVVAR